jgi:hypothetical protein
VGEAPPERRSRLLLAALERLEAFFDLGEVGEIVGRKDLSLPGGEVDLHLVELRRVDWELDEPGVAPTRGEAVTGGQWTRKGGLDTVVLPAGL